MAGGEGEGLFGGELGAGRGLGEFGPPFAGLRGGAGVADEGGVGRLTRGPPLARWAAFGGLSRSARLRILDFGLRIWGGRGRGRGRGGGVGGEAGEADVGDGGAEGDEAGVGGEGGGAVVGDEEDGAGGFDEGAGEEEGVGGVVGALGGGIGLQCIEEGVEIGAFVEGGEAGI